MNNNNNIVVKRKEDKNCKEKILCIAIIEDEDGMSLCGQGK